jgi:hypothetical protein
MWIIMFGTCEFSIILVGISLFSVGFSPCFTRTRNYKYLDPKLLFKHRVIKIKSLHSCMGRLVCIRYISFVIRFDLLYIRTNPTALSFVPGTLSWLYNRGLHRQEYRGANSGNSKSRYTPLVSEVVETLEKKTSRKRKVAGRRKKTEEVNAVLPHGRRSTTLFFTRARSLIFFSPHRTSSLRPGDQRHGRLLLAGL